MRIVIASDKSGFTLKEAIVAHLQERGIEVMDIGTKNVDEPVPFFNAAPLVAEKVQAGEADRGILCCGTGMGMSLVANRYKGVYAAACESVYSAKMCRAVNDANVLCMGGWLIADWLGLKMVDAFIDTEFTQDLEEWRKGWLQSAKEKVAALEEKLF